ncbi:hypothetical protein TraAM80_07600 [Trypanosoma rangeli]|uniref:Uncharacterized protein n=1 Tax=Trypanosoma rangeli TaxID=5698 RepID=A0A422N4K2_TRYRA|nr:uncharacterized protein TraAM80_07600 [Trypanosoma rangeli]RNF00407.1 hypothetical protein TraAM80_07600 [Trypanosoma rangeli]|eukprot:RNF00407.1 hypothetical protein TraAM80_07600 [Trypanosoma rangeli]
MHVSQKSTRYAEHILAPLSNDTFQKHAKMLAAKLHPIHVPCGGRGVLCLLKLHIGGALLLLGSSRNNSPSFEGRDITKGRANTQERLLVKSRGEATNANLTRHQPTPEKGRVGALQRLTPNT